MLVQFSVRYVLYIGDLGRNNWETFATLSFGKQGEVAVGIQGHLCFNYVLLSLSEVNICVPQSDCSRLYDAVRM